MKRLWTIVLFGIPALLFGNLGCGPACPDGWTPMESGECAPPADDDDLFGDDDTGDDDTGDDDTGDDDTTAGDDDTGDDDTGDDDTGDDDTGDDDTGDDDTGDDDTGDDDTGDDDDDDFDIGAGDCLCSADRSSRTGLAVLLLPGLLLLRRRR